MKLSVARKFEQKVAKFYKIPKDLHQSTFENIKALSKGKNIYIKGQRDIAKTRFKLVLN